MKKIAPFFFLVCLFFFSVITAAHAGREIIYAFDRDYPPHTYVKDGTPVGFDVEVLQAVVKGKDITIRYQPMQWADVQAALKKGDVHITSGMAKTPERTALFAFPDMPVCDFKTTLFSTKKGDVRSLNDLKNRAKTVATQRGSLYQKILEERGVTPALYETEADALIAVAEGRADAFAGSEKTAFFNIERHNLTGIFPVSTPLLVSSIYHVIRAHDPELLAVVNEGMRRISGDGAYDRIYRKWFVTELSREEIDRMRKKARDASFFAYAPYSNYQVGAAVLTASGNIYTGCNVESALFSYTTSAVKVAVCKAVSEGETHFKAVLCYLPGDKIGVPAADERQLLYEFGRETLAVLNNGNGGYTTVMISSLLPHPFLME